LSPSQTQRTRMPKNKQKEHRARPTPASRGLEFDVRRAQRLKTTAAFHAQRTPLQVIEVAAHAANLTDESIQRVVSEYPPSPPLACQEGCAWCCHKLVGTTAPEVFRIADYLQRHLAPQELQTVEDQIIQRDEQRKGLREDRWSAARLPCSLLVDDRCSVYPVRPLTCRGFNSSDARQCERWVKKRERVEVPIYEAQHRLATFVLDGLRAGLSESSLSDDLLELTAALRIALTLPKAFDHWLVGEPIFAPARMR
jgi:Fe-S-cluster containining protein